MELRIFHDVGRNFDGVAREAVLTIPFAAAQPAFDVGKGAAAQGLLANAGQAAYCH